MRVDVLGLRRYFEDVAKIKETAALSRIQITTFAV